MPLPPLPPPLPPALTPALTPHAPVDPATVAAMNEHSKYLSFLSHDLRGGLNGILLMIEVLKRDLAPHPQFVEQIDDLDLMRRSVLETVALMDRFIYGERFRRGLVKVRHERVDLGTLAEQMRVQFVAPARDRGVELSIRGKGVVRSDRVLLTLVISSLLGGAVQHASKGALSFSLVTGGAVAGGAGGAGGGGSAAATGAGGSPADLTEAWQAQLVADGDTILRSLIGALAVAMSGGDAPASSAPLAAPVSSMAAEGVASHGLTDNGLTLLKMAAQAIGATVRWWDAGIAIEHN